MLTWTLVWLSTPPSESARILAIFSFPGKSHFMMTKSLVTELSHRGHEVTFITGNKFDSSKLKNFTQIAIEPEYDFWKDGKKLHSKKETLKHSKYFSSS